MLTPWQMLAIALAIVLMIWLIDRVFSRTRASRMRHFARTLKMRYSPCDRFNIAGRIARSLSEEPIESIAVRDLMYRSSDAGYHYVFTVSYLCGEPMGSRRFIGVASADEPHGRSSEHLVNLKFAERNRTIPEQYASLVKSENAIQT